MSEQKAQLRPRDKFPRRRFTALTGTAILATQSGCLLNRLSAPPVDEVETAIIDVRPPSLGLGTASVIFVLQLTNHADRSVPEPVLEFQIQINSHPAGSSSTAFSTIDPGGESTERIEVIIEYSEVGAGVVESLESGQFSMRIKGSITSEGKTVQFDSST